MRTMKRLCAEDLTGKIVDIHAHVGFSLKSYAQCEYPYGQTLEGLYYKHRANSVDLGVVFPFTPELHFDIEEVARTGKLRTVEDPISNAPYEIENRVLFTELYEYCPEYVDHFLPFVCIDPMRETKKQLAAIQDLERSYPIYGMKLSPVLCQAPVTELLGPGSILLDHAASAGYPIVVHVTAHAEETWSQVRDALQVARKRPDVKFCLAHCAAFHRESLDEADSMDNVWVDTSALKIQVESAYREMDFIAPPSERFQTDYSDHRIVIRDLGDRYPDTIVWGSDSPAYSYIARRIQGEGTIYEFRLKATYEDEKTALDALSPDLRIRIGSKNATHMIFGGIHE